MGGGILLFWALGQDHTACGSNGSWLGAGQGPAPSARPLAVTIRLHVCTIFQMTKQEDFQNHTRKWLCFSDVFTYSGVFFQKGFREHT